MSTSIAGPAGSFQTRRIDVKFKLGTNQDGAGSVPSQQMFVGTDANTITLTGPRVSAIVQNAGGISQGALDMRVYGLTQSHMNQLTVLKGPNVTQSGYTVTVSAGTAASGMATVYAGIISQSFPDYAGAPDVALHVTSLDALDLALMSTPPNSYPGSADVATIMANLARINGLGFENNGVTVRLSNPYFYGSPLSQIESCAEAAGIEYAIVNGGAQRVLAIWPRGESRGGLIPLVSRDTGMYGYPTRTPTGVDVKTIYNPAINFGSQIKVVSDIPSCCGVWSVKSMSHYLESETPDGLWFTTLSCASPGVF